MKISILASGSKGNSTYIGTHSTNILIDIGTSCAYVERNLRDIGVEPQDIVAILVTHVHVDHISGLKVFCKKYNPEVYLTNKMYNELKNYDIKANYIIIDSNFNLNELEIETIKTSHDVEDSCGYIVKNNNHSVVYITDTGYINIKEHPKLLNHDMYIMESNHDVEMLMNGNRPYHIKQRILGDRGHLSNKQSADYLAKFCGPNTKHIVLAHLSHDNNKEEIAYENLIEILNNHNIKVDDIVIAKQDVKTELIEI